MHFDDILRRFSSSKKRGSGYQCKCPAHDDRMASLSVSEKNGKILIHCHAGCKTEDVLSAVGLSFKDLGEECKEEVPKWKQGLERRYNKRIEAIYDYYSANKKYLYSKVRFEGKVIRYFTIDRERDCYKDRKEENKESSLYRLPELIEAVRNRRPIYIVEGEKDVETLRRMGYAATTAGGANNWRREYATYFTGAQVIIFPDNDGPGLNLKDQIVKDLKHYAHSIQWTLTSQTEKGDVTDYLKKEMHTKEDLEQLVANAEKTFASWLYLTGKEPNQQLRVNAGILADSISRNLPYLIVRRPDEEKDDFYLYENGVYSKCNRNKVKSVIMRYIPASLTSDQLINNVCNLLFCQERNICSFRDLDTDEKYINLKNGLYNLNTRQLEPHTPKLYSTIQLNCEYIPEKVSKPVFDRYIDDLCSDREGKIDEEKKAVLQEYMGLILSNVKVHRTKLCLVLWSLMGNSGKTQLLNLIGELLGSDRIANIPIQHMNEESKFALGSLIGKRMISIGDQTSSEIKDSSVFKQLTGGDPVKVEPKGKQPFYYRFPGGIVIACNNLPTFTDDKGGHLFERLCVVPCTNTIAQERRDSSILDKMLKEREAVLNWFLQGLHRLIDNNYKVTESESCKLALNEYRERMDTVYRYLSEFYVITGSWMDMISKSDFDADYMEWCKTNGYTNVNKQNIKDRMEANGCAANKGNLGGKRGVMVYHSLKKKNDGFQDATQDSFEQCNIPFL